MKHLKRWLCAALTLVLSAALILPARAADPMATSFANFLMEAANTDSPEVALRVALYRRDSAGNFVQDTKLSYPCGVNRTVGQSVFYIQPNVDNVWVTVDYLTDLNSDGVYEMLDGENTPIHDSMNVRGELAPWDGTVHTLNQGQTYLLSAETLASRGAQVLQARNTAGSGQTLPGAGGAVPELDHMLYLVTLHYNSPVDQKEYTLSYYLRLYPTVIVPSDVPANAWYYDAVEYVLDQGLCSGTGADSFSPTGTVTRAQMAQILWRMGGSQSAEQANFSDVSPSDWYSSAVSWCSQEGMMTGSGTSFLPNAPLTREQLALILQQYARYAGLNPVSGTSLSRFTDGTAAASWATPALEWAVGEGLLSGYDNGALRPSNSITRAELAAVLRTFQTTMLDN
jgi:hypothetical protein